jgi:hypothetical protein
MSTPSSTVTRPSNASMSDDEFIDPYWTSFIEMTEIVDALCATYFRTFMKGLKNIKPRLSGVEIGRVQSIARIIGRYDRSPSFDERGSCPFRLVASPQEAWIFELVVGVSLGKRIYCGWEYVSRDVDDHLSFLLGLQERINASEVWHDSTQL